MGRKGQAYYYVTNDRPRRWLPLGQHYGMALIEWARLEGKPVPDCATTFTQIAVLYRRDALPEKARSTQIDNLRELERLEAVFGDSPLETIRPGDVKRYLCERVDKHGTPVTTRANREIALLSHLINFARERGLVDMHNPCLGIRKNREQGRDRYVDDSEFQAIYDASDEVLRDALDLLLLTSQRPGDVIRFKRTDIRDGDLWVCQAKTGTKIRISIEGELATSIERMLTRERTATGVYLLQDDKGQPFTYWRLEGRFVKARAKAAAKVPSVADIQLRDLRSKAATDVENLEHAQKLLGHRTRTMTEHYVKHRPTDRVAPLRRKPKL